MEIDMSLNELSMIRAEAQASRGVAVKDLDKYLEAEPHAVAGRHESAASREQLSSVSVLDASKRRAIDAGTELVAVYADLAEKTKRSVSKAKDQAQQMTDAMNKLTKQLGPDFEARLLQLERLTECMERLAALQKTGQLEAVMSAMARK